MINKNFAEYIIVKRSLHKESSFTLHFHDNAIGGYDFELLYVLGGSATHIVEGERYELSRGDFAIIDYGQRHAFENIQGNLELFNVIFDYRAIDIYHSKIKSLAELAYAFGVNTDFKIKDTRNDYNFHDDAFGSTLDIIRKIEQELDVRASGYHQMVKGYLIEILINCFRSYFHVSNSAVYSPPIMRIVDYVTDFYMYKATLSEFASELGLSVPYLSKLFKDETGTTFTEYLHHRRIEESCRLISTTNSTIEEIAEMVGYSDSKKFRARFKYEMGITPREYKNRTLLN